MKSNREKFAAKFDGQARISPFNKPFRIERLFARSPRADAFSNVAKPNAVFNV
jgi:hypothetical protein